MLKAVVAAVEVRHEAVAALAARCLGFQQRLIRALEEEKLLDRQIEFIDQDKKAPYVQQYSFDINRELPGNIAIGFEYVGATGRDLNRRVEFHLQLASDSKAKTTKGESGPTFPDSRRQDGSRTVSSR